jgi:N-glycosylase/DNA lyase
VGNPFAGGKLTKSGKVKYLFGVSRSSESDLSYRHCGLKGRIVSLGQEPDHLRYRATWPVANKANTRTTSAPFTSATANSASQDDTEGFLRSYFNLHQDLSALYEQWSRDDANFRKKAPKFSGIRILNQDAWEALVAFICSSNNNISRISQMVHKLCLHYGPFLGTIGDEVFHDFPTPESLTGAKVEAHLRELGFGYRAKYIAETARLVAREKPAGWLTTLRNPESSSWGDNRASNPKATYKEAHEELLTLAGVGPKVADCVCLMGLGWGEAVPVDTHVWQIAVRDYSFGKWKAKTFSKVMYDAIGDHFRGLWGKQAGWAQSVLFTANLRAFSDRLITKDEPSVVTIKEEETVVDIPISGRRKRKAVVTTRIKVEVAAEVAKSEDVAISRSKRRRKL